MKFAKFESTGNDFILLNNLSNSLNHLSSDFISKLCHRQRGIGADGLILVNPSTSQAHLFSMKYFNSDGIEAEMCGNGVRAMIFFVKKFCGLTAKNGEYFFETHSSEGRAKIISEELNESTVEVQMPLVTEISALAGKYSWEEGYSLDLNTGVPHLCLECKDAKKTNVSELGRKFRASIVFPKGTNVNFFTPLSENHAIVRTFERGVEGETLSCGTGAVAVGKTMQFKSKSVLMTNFILEFPGGILEVDLRGERPLLKGRTRLVFTGELAEQI